MKLVPLAAAVLLSAPLGHARADAPLAAPPAIAIPLDDALPADSLLGKWWSEGKEGLLEIVKTKTGHYEAILVGGKDAVPGQFFKDVTHEWVSPVPVAARAERKGGGTLPLVLPPIRPLYGVYPPGR